MFVPMKCSNDMRRLLLLLSLAIALVAMAIPATSGAKTHGKRHNARVADRNHNGMSDRWERKFRVHKAKADPDRDGVKNLGEYHNGTKPRDADSDNDGVNDGDDDSNHDGIDDGDEQSGTIKSFDGTKLIVTLVNGDVVSGTVTDRTEIECDDTTPPSDPGTTIPGAAKTRHDGGGGDDDGPGDDHGTDDAPANPTTTPSPQPPSDDDHGDDHGDDDEHGDDEHGDDDTSNCGKAALIPGTIVREAELSLTSTGAIFHKIELGGKAPA
jgi:hypothetical protein